MSCKLAIIGVLCLVYCTGSVHAAPGNDCNGGGSGCEEGEVCNTNVCECDNGYEESGDPKACTLKDCASDMPSPTGYTNLQNTLFSESATAECDTNSGYLGTAIVAAGACKADGTWDSNTFSGCTLDCSVKNPTPAGYVLTGSTEENGTPTVTCNEGYDGTPTNPKLTCQADGDYDLAFNGCTPKDCASDTSSPIGYTNLQNTLFSETATAECDASNGYAGTAIVAADACKADGTWDGSKFSGCALGAGATLLSMFNVVSMIACYLMIKLM